MSVATIPPADIADVANVGDIAGPSPSVWRRVFRARDYDTVSYLTAYLVLLMFIPSSLIFAPLGGTGTPAAVFSVGLLLWYIASWLVGRIIPSGAGRAIRTGMLLYSLAVIASFVAAMTRDATQVEVLGAIRGLLTIAAWAGLLIVITQSVTSYDRLETLLRRLVIFGSIVAAIGILEYYSGLNFTNYIQIPGLSNNIDFNTLMDRNGLNRPSSTSVDPIEFGVVMSMILPLALHQAITYTHLGQLRMGFLRRWLPVVLIAGAIPLSVSRSGLVTAAAGLIVLFVAWTPRQRITAIVFGVLGLGALKAVAPGLIGTFLNFFAQMFGPANSQQSVSTRTDDYARNWQYIVERPFFGRGFGTFLPEIYSWTDNMYLNTLIEVGCVGLICLLVLYLAGIHCAASGRRYAQGEARRSLGQALLATIVVACVGTAIFDSLGFPMFAGTFFLLLGLTGAYQGIMKRESTSLPTLLPAMAAANPAMPE